MKKAEDRASNNRDSRPTERKPFNQEARPEFKKPEFNTETSAPATSTPDALKFDNRKKELPKKKEKAKDFADGNRASKKCRPIRKVEKTTALLTSATTRKIFD